MNTNNYVSVHYGYIKNNVGIAYAYYRHKRSEVKQEFIQNKMKEFNQEQHNLFNRIKYVFFPNSKKEYLWEYQVEARLNEENDWNFEWWSARNAYQDILDELEGLSGLIRVINEDEKYNHTFYIDVRIFEAIQKACNNVKLKKGE